MPAWGILLVIIMTLWGNLCLLASLIGGYIDDDPIGLICMIVAVGVDLMLIAFCIWIKYIQPESKNQ